MSVPILVIGALGNVGAEVIKHVLAKGGTVRAADIDARKIKERFGDSVEAVRFDFTDPATYTATFQGVKKMFYMRPPHLTNIQRDMSPSMDAAKQAGITHVVFLSLIGIENAKYVPHYKVETYLHKINLQTTFLRCSFFMQNLNTTHRKEIRERNEIFVPVGNAKTIFIDARDIGAVAALALTEEGHAGKNYDLTGSEALDYWEATRIMSEVLRRKIIYRDLNPFYFLIETIRGGTPFMFALVQMGLYTFTRFGMAQNVTHDVESLTGRKPILFRQYVIDYKDNWLGCGLKFRKIGVRWGKRKRRQRMKKGKAEEEWKKLSDEVIAGTSAWREKHPKATMREIEEEVDKRLSVMRARMIADTAMKSGRAEWEMGKTEAVCPKCGGELLKKGKKKRKLETREGQGIELEREYGICLNCGHGIFPPR